MHAPRAADTALDFAIPVAEGGYAWWYLDALSPDGRFGVTVIAFVGSVFSPYYASARAAHRAGAAGPADPLDHCCLNVCLYLPQARRWTMIERARAQVTREMDRLAIGPSGLTWDGTHLRIRFAEATALKATPVEGEITVRPGPLLSAAFPLDPAGRHLWRPLSVDAQVEVRLDAPAGVWSGAGYLDHNIGTVPLEHDFRRWSWNRSAVDAQGRALVDYDVELVGGARRAMSLEIGPQGVREVESPPARALRPTAWGLPRRVHAGRRHVIRTFEDAPFYARSSVCAWRDGVPRVMMHEHLALGRFTYPLMQWALPYRVKREG